MYEDFVEKYLEVTNKVGDEWMCFCVYHDNKNTASFRINIESGLHICYSCGVGGNIDKLREYLGAQDVIGGDDSELSKLRKQLDSLDEPDDDTYIVPESVLARYDNPGEYWLKRGFTEHTIERFGLGLDIMGNYATIPFREFGGELLGVIKRYFDPEEVGRKYKYPKKFRKSSELFASWMVYSAAETRSVALVEGSLDAIRLWQAGIPALAIYGSSLSEEQRRLLDFLDIREVILFFDNDEAGWKATKGALGFEKKLYRSRRDGKLVKGEVHIRDNDLRMVMNVRAVRYPDHYPDDPGAMSDDQLHHMVSMSKRR